MVYAIKDLILVRDMLFTGQSKYMLITAFLAVKHEPPCAGTYQSSTGSLLYWDKW